MYLILTPILENLIESNTLRQFVYILKNILLRYRFCSRV